MSRYLTTLISVLLIASLSSCTKEDDSASSSPSTLTPVPPPQHAQPKKRATQAIQPSATSLAQVRPIYNQAYQENYDADSINDILPVAHNAYVLLDPFEKGIAGSIAAIKKQSNEVGCYISVGTGENWRSDFAQLKPYLVKKQWGEWEGEYFIDQTRSGALDIMKVRIDRMATWGCNWVEFDNMDWTADDDYREEYQFQATLQDSIDYTQALCRHVQQYGMKCMAKNTVDHYANFDGVLYESYNDDKNWWDQEGTRQFLAAGKLVIINHYNEAQCDKIYAEYKILYSDKLSFICEDTQMQKYRHYNQ